MTTIERRIDDNGVVWEKTGRWSTGVLAKQVHTASGVEIGDQSPFTLGFRSWEAMRVAPGYPERSWGFWEGEGAAPSIARGRELYLARITEGGRESGLYFAPWEAVDRDTVDRYITFGRDEKEARAWHEAASDRPWDEIPDDEKVDVIRAYQTRPPKPPRATDRQVAAGAAAIDDLLEQLGVPADDRERDELGLVNGSPEETSATHPQTREIIARAAIEAAFGVGR